MKSKEKNKNGINKQATQSSNKETKRATHEQTQAIGQRKRERERERERSNDREREREKDIGGKTMKDKKGIIK